MNLRLWNKPTTISNCWKLKIVSKSQMNSFFTVNRHFQLKMMRWQQWCWGVSQYVIFGQNQQIEGYTEWEIVSATRIFSRFFFCWENCWIAMEWNGMSKRFDLHYHGLDGSGSMMHEKLIPNEFCHLICTEIMLPISYSITILLFFSFFISRNRISVMLRFQSNLKSTLS